MPVTIGSTILLPADCPDWSAVKRSAVLAHENSHVACGDFLILLLAVLHRAVFWFNPLSWWLLRRLAELAEAISDDAAIEVLGDRPAYAAILLDVARDVRPTSLGIAMARVRTVHRRIERILAAAAPSSRISRRKRILLWFGFLPIVAVSATSIARGIPPAEVQHVTGLQLAQADQPARAEIGFLNDLSPDQWQPAMTGFRRGLSEAGYVEGQNVTFVYRWTEGRRDSLPDLAGGLARANVSLIVSSGDTAAALAARAATSKIPVLFAIEDDPVKFGFAESLDKPGGNATGMYFVDPSGALGTTRQELLRQLVPNIGSVFYVLQILDASSDTRRTEPATALKSLLDGVRTRSVPLSADIKQLLRTDPEKALKQLQQQVGTPDDSDRIDPDRMHSLEVNSGPFLDARRRSQTIALAARYGIPTLYHWRGFVEAGGLISHGFEIEDAYVQLGRYAGRILNGANPAEMPIMKPTKRETAINLRTAAELGLSVPPAMLARVDEVIQ
jgi:putative ABC transport system substrate-binding protein